MYNLKSFHTYLTKLFFILVVSISFYMLFLQTQAFTPDSQFNILIVNSYHNGHKWESNVLEGFLGSMEEYDNPYVNIKLEYLDFRSSNDSLYLDTFKNFLTTKYPKGSIDAIYTIDDEAYNLLASEISNPKSEFYQLPLVFSGVNEDSLVKKQLSPYITGIYQQDVTFQLLSFIFQLDETVDEIKIITEDSGYGNDLIAQVSTLLDTYWPDQVELHCIQSDYIEDIEYNLCTDNPHSNAIIILGGEFQYKKYNKFLEPNETVNIIKSYCNVPIYSNDQTYLSTGIMGGCMDIGQKQGHSIFEIVKRMIEGERVENISPILAPPPQWLLDYNSIYNYDVEIINIPEQSIIFNKKFYQLLIPAEYKNLFRSLILLIGCTFILFTVLGIKHLYRHKKMKKILQQKVQYEQLRTDFIVNLSHELRTPTNVILTAIQLIRLELSSTLEESNHNAVYKQLDNITKHAYRLLKISNNIVDITKLECGKLSFNPQNWNVVEVVEDIFMSIQDYATKKQLQIIFDPEEEEFICAIDKELLQRAILNLLSNAIKFTPPQGKINGTIRHNDAHLIIEIWDTGIGIPQDKLDAIFNRFYQIDNTLTRVNEGSGIGLCIVKEIIALHDGSIQVTSQEHKGSRFIITLPYIQTHKTSHHGYISSIETAVNIELSDVIK